MGAVMNETLPVNPTGCEAFQREISGQRQMDMADARLFADPSLEAAQ